MKNCLKKTITARGRIIELRKKNFSNAEIKEKMEKEGKDISDDAISKILKGEGFAKLFRRTNHEHLEALQSDKKYPEQSSMFDFEKQTRFTTSYGVCFFLALIPEV